MHNELYTTEYDVENKFIKVITTNWYKYNNLSSYEELLVNFREKLNLLNKDILNSKPLTDAEFKEIIIYLENKNKEPDKKSRIVYYQTLDTIFKRNFQQKER